jgi:aminotransferase
MMSTPRSSVLESSLKLDDLISERARAIDASGIRRVFDLGAKLKDPINLSIGQPDFPVPEAMKQAAIDAIRADRNGYTVTQGTPGLLDAIWAHLREDVGWSGPSESPDGLGAFVTSGTSGALLLAAMVLLNPGDEAIIPDPYFVMYPQLGPLTGGRMVACDTYPDFRMTAERVEPLITPRTKFIIVNSPGNPSGTVLSAEELRELVDLCDRRGVLLITDEIYDQFTFSDARQEGRFPSPARFSDRVLLIRGFGKTYGCTGWRLGYAAGPRRLIQEMAKLQQYTFVCAPAPLQAAAAAAFGVDMSPLVAAYEKRRNMVVEAFSGLAEITAPGGAFYAFVGLPQRLLARGESGSSFVERAIANSVLIIPGKVFSRRDTHFRLSFATAEPTLKRGLDVLTRLMAE